MPSCTDWNPAPRRSSDRRVHWIDVVLDSSPYTTAFARLRSEEHTSELQSHSDLVCRLRLEKKEAESAARLGVYLRYTYWITSSRRWFSKSTRMSGRSLRSFDTKRSNSMLMLAGPTSVMPS